MQFLTSATSPDVAEQAADVAVLPVGSFEQHGEHLPLSTDTLIASILAERVSEAYSLFLLPPITISCSHEHASFRGTVSITATTLLRVVEDVLYSLRPQGVDRLIIISGHGGNYALSNLAQQLNSAGPRRPGLPHGAGLGCCSDRGRPRNNSPRRHAWWRGRNLHSAELRAPGR